MTPEDVGLPNGGRRRTPGLRREEVAMLAGVGTTWYTWLEQGRDVRASLDVLDSLSRALKLSAAERIHLILLGRGEEGPAASSAPGERVSPAIKRVIENLGLNPAFLLGYRWDYLAWNKAATVLFGDLGAIPRARRNHVWLMFTDPARREMFVDWKQGSRLCVAKFRADSARHLGDQAFEELIAALRNASPEFCREWRRHEVATGSAGLKLLNHPVEGNMVFEHAAFNPSDSPDQRLVLYTPVPVEDTPAKLARLMAA